jgi:hypothetical protein
VNFGGDGNMGGREKQKSEKRKGSRGIEIMKRFHIQIPSISRIQHKGARE